MSRRTIFLRRQRAQDIIEGREPLNWKDDDYAVVDGITFGRIYKERLPGGEKWRWFLFGPFVTLPHGVQGSGIADTLEEAKADLVVQYAKVRPGS